MTPSARTFSGVNSKYFQGSIQPWPKGSSEPGFSTLYIIRYFQYEGKGTLKLVDGPTLVNNDRVLLESKEFRLNYTAKSADSQEIYICIEDNYGTRWEQTFEFNNSDGDGGSGSLVVTPINPGTITPINY